MKEQKVYIVHGILGGAYEYGSMRRFLKKNGFEAEVFSYKSRKTPILKAGKNLYDRIKKENPSQISFITHSLGGLVLRAMLQYSLEDLNFPKIHRIVMIAPPNQGTISANYIHRYAFLRFIIGVNLRDIKDDKGSLAKKLPVDFSTDVGIIAGISGHKWGYNPLIGEDNDGEIRPEETKLGTEKDFIIVKSNHIGILHNRKTIKLTAQFLKTGRF
ncbi:hypothetical protein [Proteiniphilum sp.]|uniref:DUF7379 domain-containing protein n=1 Tax=Proteiniphilum sp. TaxID=1926877 RepID=UPI002B21BD83|nr:hypothetical protein [Proteiniphilum sp.]MEA4918590.1 hypothetical protein [Proteiniphilum sp.]